MRNVWRCRHAKIERELSESPRAKADMAGIGDVWCAKEIGQPTEKNIEELPRMVVTMMEVHSFGPVIGLYLPEPLGDFIKRSIPTNLLPLTRAAVSSACLARKGSRGNAPP